MKTKHSQKEYLEWIYHMALRYSKPENLVDAVWERVRKEAERDGYLEKLESDKTIITDIIKTFMEDIGKSKSDRR